MMNNEMILDNVQKLKTSALRHNNPGSFLCIPLDDNEGCTLPVEIVLQMLEDSGIEKYLIKTILQEPKR